MRSFPRLAVAVVAEDDDRESEGDFDSLATADDEDDSTDGATLAGVTDAADEERSRATEGNTKGEVKRSGDGVTLVDAAAGTSDAMPALEPVAPLATRDEFAHKKFEAMGDANGSVGSKPVAAASAAFGTNNGRPDVSSQMRSDPLRTSSKGGSTAAGELGPFDDTVTAVLESNWFGLSVIALSRSRLFRPFWSLAENEEPCQAICVFGRCALATLLTPFGEVMTSISITLALVG